MDISAAGVLIIMHAFDVDAVFSTAKSGKNNSIRYWWINGLWILSV